ncbi:MAG: histidine phosphatase family protein [Xanthomonadales bacterium]|nr:histidine phosphatase family protein [Xanthomonadales bacterium]NIX13231.1 histidine phosphatase family protein [Xanthomonadales bacterium]
MGSKQRVLYLVRHAKSSWKDPSLADRNRPLNDRGARNAPDMGRRLAAHGHVPGLIVTSPAKRALMTARAIAGELGIAEADIVVEDDLYFHGSLGMLRVLEQVDDRHGKVMIVGHNPTITHVLNDLADTGIHNMVTCAVAIVGLDMDSWSEVGETFGDLLGYGFPKGREDFSLKG